MKKNLDQWLAFLESNHPTEIDMGLDRVKQVAQCLELLKPTKKVLLVAGTNGKGSTVTMCSSILNAAGYSVGSYMSPHLHTYNERVRINGVPVSDELIVESFEAIDAARKDISLTYFEVGTLSALYIFKQANLDVSVLEIGLGGRLDAVNIVEADASAVTSIGLDHQDWLGDDISQIAFEKAGVYRAHCPAVCGERSPAQTLRNHANEIGAYLAIKGEQFDFESHGDVWDWKGIDHKRELIEFKNLPRPSLPLENAATSLQLLLQAFPQLTRNNIDLGLKNALLTGRLQQFHLPFNGLMDVGHNPQAAKLLESHLASHPISGKRFAVLAMLIDKDALAVVSELSSIDTWCLAGLDGYRGQTVDALNAKVKNALPATRRYDSVFIALDELSKEVTENDEVIVFGSFSTVANAQAWLNQQMPSGA